MVRIQKRFLIKKKKLKLNLLINGIDLDCTKETTKNFDDCLPLVTQEIISVLLGPALINLRQITDIPRLFRRMNRDVPTKPCPYVKSLLNFFISCYADYKTIVTDKVRSWFVLALTDLTLQ